MNITSRHVRSHLPNRHYLVRTPQRYLMVPRTAYRILLALDRAGGQISYDDLCTLTDTPLGTLYVMAGRLKRHGLVTSDKPRNNKQVAYIHSACAVLLMFKDQPKWIGRG